MARRRTRVRSDVDLRPFYRYIRGVRLRSRDFRGVFKAAMKDLEKAHAQNFASQGGLVGGWKPAYSDWKLEDYGAGGTLVRTGALRNSLTVSNARGAVRDIGLKQAEFGTSLNYAHFHQTGTEDMAARKIVFVPRSFAEGLGRDALDHVAYGDNPVGAFRRALNMVRR